MPAEALPAAEAPPRPAPAAPAEASRTDAGIEITAGDTVVVVDGDTALPAAVMGGGSTDGVSDVVVIPKGRALIDSGRGHHLVSTSTLLQFDPNALRKLNPPSRNILLQTANGITEAEHEVKLSIGGVGGVTKALVLESTPLVLSLGKKCIEEGYSFHWPVWSKKPFWVFGLPLAEQNFYILCESCPIFYLLPV